MGKQIGQSGNSATSPPAPAILRARAPCEVLRGLAYSAAGSRMLSELAPVMTTTLSLTPIIKFCFLRKPTVSFCW